MPPLELHVLGPFTVVVAGQPAAHFPTDKVRALLVYLALEGDPPLRREILSALFWPEQPETGARQNLRQSLYRLKRLLNGEKDGLGDRMLQVSPKSIGIDSHHCRVDAADFLQLVAAVDAHDHLSLAHCTPCIERLETAVALYRGEFLSGLFLTDALQFDEWLVTMRERFHHEMLRALTALADAHEDLGHHEAAYSYAQRQLNLEPWREAAHRQIMRLLMLAGDRQQAIAQYELCVRILDEELGIEPAPETKALYAQIAAGEQLPSPAPRAVSSLAHFPTPPRKLVGREQDIEQIIALLNRPDCRLLTLSGLGGIGKTSLAIAAAQEMAHGTLFADGLYFVALADLATPDLLVSALAHALDLRLNSRRDYLAQVQDYLRDKACLLVMDNFEHLLPAAPILADLTAVAPQLKILLTSREPLNIQIEQRLTVSGLDYPGPDTQDKALSSYGAVRLFVQEAQRVRPDFELSPANEAEIGEICRLVHGIPLAVTFAAGWLRLMDCAQIKAEIGRNLDFLATSMRDVPERHRSLRAVFEQSWQWLSSSERDVFAQLAVFGGSFTLDAVLSVTHASHSDLAHLLDRSFLLRIGEDRYRCHELLQQFSAEKLAQDPQMAAQVKAKHSQYYLTFVHRREGLIFGPDSQQALGKMQNELNNIRGAWQTAVEQRTWPLIQDSLDGVVYFCMLAGHFVQVASMLAQALAHSDRQENAQLTGYLLSHQANVFIRQGHFAEATEAMQQATAIAAEEEDKRLQARLAMSHGRLLELQGDYEQGLSTLLAAHAYYESTGNKVRLTRTARLIGNLYWRQSYFDRAAPYYQQSLALAQEVGDKVFQAVVLGDLGVLSTDRSAFDEAINYLQRALTVDQEIGNREGVARHTHNIGRIYRLQEKWSQAMSYFEQALQTAEDLGLRRGVSVCLTNMGIVYARTGSFEQAIIHYKRALEINEELGIKEGVSNNIGNLGNVYRKMGRLDEAEACHRNALAIAQEMGHLEGIARHLLNIAAVEQDRQAWDCALETYQRAVTAYRKFDDPYSLSAALVLHGEVYMALGQYGQAEPLIAEGLSLAESVQRKDYTLRGRLQMAKLDAATGHPEAGTQQLLALLAAADQAADRALINDELWQMGAGEAHRAAAVDLYRTLINQTPDITYIRRLEALSASDDDAGRK